MQSIKNINPMKRTIIFLALMLPSLERALQSCTTGN